MRLLQLKLKNFKGVRDFTLDTQGGNVNIFADNAVGKTTLQDAFTWLLFDKDGSGKKDFAIKTLDSSGKVIHKLSHEVEGQFEIDGKMVVLKKVYAERWTKKRGSATATFTGHTVDHFVGGVPVKKKDYDAAVAGFADEDIFKLLTNPTFFNEQLHWQERRKTLLDISGDINDAEVIASDSALANLPQILNSRTLEDHRKIIASRRAEINKELDKIPVRVDEATRSMPELPAVSDKHQYDRLIASIKAQRTEKAAELARLESGGEVAEKQRRVAEIETELIQIKNQHEVGYGAVITNKNNELTKISTKIMGLEIDLRRDKSQHSDLLEKVASAGEAMEALRDKWRSINDQEFTCEQEDTCPTCGQSLPEEQVQQVKEKALTAFNTAKAEQLGSVNSEGKKLKAEHGAAREEADKLTKKILEVEHKIATETTKLSELKDEIVKLQTTGRPVTDSPTYARKQKEKDSLLAEISNIKDNSRTAIEAVRAQIEELDGGINGLMADLQKIELRESGLKRIEELKAQEKELAAEFEKLEGELFLCESFIKAKVAMLEEKINSRFKYARFKLFETQINGGIVEVCETLYNGVPYSSGLNNGHRGIVGLDIIATLAEHYNFHPPIFYDNAESVTRLPEMKSQMIAMYVSERDKTLRIEIEEKTMKEAI